MDVAVDHWGNVIASFNAGGGKPAGIDVAPARPGTYYGVHMKVGHTYRLVSGGGFQVAPDRAGNLLVAGDGPDRVGVIAGTTGHFYGRKMTAGKLYDIAGTGTAGFSGDGGPAAKAKLNAPDGVAVDGAGNVVIGDTGNKRIRVVAERSGRSYGLTMKAGDIYTVAGDGVGADSGDGGPAMNAGVSFPDGLAIDAAGNLVIADAIDSRIRVVAIENGTFYGQSMTAGDVYTIAGDLGVTDEFGTSGPTGITVDGAGKLLIADPGADAVWLVAATSGTFYGVNTTAGQRYEIAGGGTTGRGDGGPGTKAELSPYATAVDAQGDLVIADQGPGRIRLLTH